LYFYGLIKAENENSSDALNSLLYNEERERELYFDTESCHRETEAQRKRERAGILTT
jgi:hypothetical protein